MDKILINIRQLSDLIDVRVNTIYCWASQRRIPFVKCGRLIKFDLQKIEKWIEENSVEEKKFDHIRDRRSY